MLLRYKILVAFLLLTVAALVATGSVYFQKSQEALRRSILSHLETTAQIQGHRVEGLLRQNRERLNLITSRTQLRLSLRTFDETADERARDRISRIIRDARDSVEDFEEIYVLSPSGRIVASTDSTVVDRGLADSGLHGLVPEAGTHEAVRAVRGVLKLFLSGPLLLNDETVGLLIVQSTTVGLERIAYDYSGLGLTGETIIAIDAEGTPRSITPPRFDRTAVMQALSVDPFRSDAGAAGPPVLLEDSDYRGVAVLAVAHPIGDSNWGVIVKIDRDEALSPLADLQLLLALSLVVAVVITIVLSAVFSRALTKPITDLTQVALMIANGDLSRRIDRFSRDELGMLAKAFNQMADRLIDANQTLEARVQDKTRELLDANEKLVVANTQLKSLSDIDGLTQIANRRSFEETLDTELNRCRRQSSPLALVMLDVDFFKKFNDLSGHQSGDACLKQIAAILSTHTRRAGELVARFGGEEFAMVLPHQDIAEAARSSETVRAAIEAARIHHPDSEIADMVTVSLGVVSLVPDQQITAERLIELADKALYRAKHHGRNRVETADLKDAA